LSVDSTHPKNKELIISLYHACTYLQTWTSIVRLFSKARTPIALYRHVQVPRSARKIILGLFIHLTWYSMVFIFERCTYIISSSAL